tara:strand:+ start:7362 stop:7706 length:345 start_codon:yes stop_codon:yes gene_type:complete
MLVDISYTIPIEELPTRAKELISKDIDAKLVAEISPQLTEICNLLDEAPTNSEKVLQKLNKVYGDLAFVNLRLRNIISMVTGHQEVLLQKRGDSIHSHQPPEPQVKEEGSNEEG